MVKVTSLLKSAPEFVFGARAPTEMKLSCVTGMCVLTVVSSEINLSVEELRKCFQFLH